jgi:two-component system alkaline phosphatase synthesis response regulator PhoP
MTSILIIEDEFELARVLKTYLEQSGFKATISGRGDQGLHIWQQENPDLVLLDLNLPGMDGLDVIREARKTLNTPVIMITARVDDIDQMIGLEVGADDYITKPFSPRVLISHVRAVLRRASPPMDPGKLISIGDIRIDVEGHRVNRGNQEIELTATEFRLLIHLTLHPGRTYSRTQLLEVIQGEAFAGYERTVDAHIKNLRAKIETNPGEPELIETVYGVGYRFKRF